jgi:nucleoside-diphosphate-sugar epimerase
MSRVLVTGASGCVGRAAVPELVRRGWDVHAVSSREITNASPDVVWHRANLLDTTDVQRVVTAVRPTHLLHLAWYVAPGRWASAPDNFAWVKASLDLLDAFRTAGGRRVVSAGSCLEYDWDFGYCSEASTPCAPHTIYGTCKHALERLTQAFSQAHGFSSAWGRIFFLYGPHEHPDRLIAHVVRSLLNGEPARCSHGNQIRDYLFVRDVANAFVALLESDVEGPLNVASGRPIALKDLVMRAGTRIGRPELVQLGAIPAAPTDAPLVVANVSRLHASLDWRPAFDLERGLDETIEWWRQQRQVGPEPLRT